MTIGQTPRRILGRRLATVFLALLPFLAQAADDPPLPLTDDEVAHLLTQYKKNRELRPEAALLEPSKVLLLPHVLPGLGSTRPGGLDHLAVEVEFNETFFPYQNPPSAGDRHFGGLVAKVGITPMYRVRIWKARSAPVRVPSFMPKGSIQLDYYSRRERGLQWGQTRDKTGAVRAKPIVIHTLTLTPLGHHSNGQDGCLFADAQDVAFPTDACPSIPAEDAIRINRFDGSFSTNYAEVSYFRRQLSLSPGNADYDVDASIRGLWDKERRAAHSWFVGATVQFNYPIDVAGGALEQPARSIYGMNRLRIMAGYEKHWREAPAPRSRLRRLAQNAFKARIWGELSSKSRDVAGCVAATVRSPSPVCAPKFSWGVDLTISLFNKADGLGLYTRFLQAQDYYNLSFFQRKDNRFQTGLSFSLSRGRGIAVPVINDRVLRTEETAPGSWISYQKAVWARSKALAK